MVRARVWARHRVRVRARARVRAGARARARARVTFQRSCQSPSYKDPLVPNAHVPPAATGPRRLSPARALGLPPPASLRRRGACRLTYHCGRSASR